MASGQKVRGHAAEQGGSCRHNSRGAVYGGLAYDLDRAVRERQLDEAGKAPPEEGDGQAQPEVQPVQRRQSAARAAVRPSPVLLLGNGAGGGHGHRADAVLCAADRHFR